MSADTPVRKSLVAVVVAMTAALMLRAWLQVELIAAGVTRSFAADLSYLIVPPVLLFLLYPIWRQQGAFLTRLFQPKALTMSLLMRAIAIGCLLRLASWCELIAGVSFGWYRNADPNAITGPVFSFNCPTPPALSLGALVMVVIVPFVEETVHRGLVQSWLAKHGAIVAIGVSALAFMLAHRPSTWAFVFVAGVVLGIQYWRSGSLWSSLATHATINGLILLDWRCLQGRWNPPPDDIPVWTSGIVGLCGLVLAILSIGVLLANGPGARRTPRV